MFTLKENKNRIEVSLTPEFVSGLGQLIQIVFPLHTQSFIPEGKIVCILESNRKLLTIKNPVEGVFREFNESAERFAEQYTPETMLFSMQRMTREEYDKELQAKKEKAASKKKVVATAAPAAGAAFAAAERGFARAWDNWDEELNRNPLNRAPRNRNEEAVLRNIEAQTAAEMERQRNINQIRELTAQLQAPGRNP